MPFQVSGHLPDLRGGRFASGVRLKIFRHMQSERDCKIIENSVLDGYIPFSLRNGLAECAVFSV